MTTVQQYKFEETMALIQERAKVLMESDQPPVFDITLNRRNASTGFPVSIASLTNATVEQISEPMRWVPMLCGGGEYIINVRHPSLPGRIGGPLPFSFSTEGPGMQPHPPDPMVTLRPDWQGPKLVTPPPPDPNTMRMQQVPTNGAVATGPVTVGYGLPSAPVVTGPSDRERELAQQLADMKANQARMEAEAKAQAQLEAVKREAEQRVRDAERKAEDHRRESDMKLRELESKITTIAATPAPQPKQDTLAVISQIASIFMPLIQQMLQSQHESRQMMLKLNEDQNRRQLEQNEKQHAATMEMIRAMSAKPSGMSEEMKLLIETLKSQNQGSGSEAIAGMVSRMAEAMSVVTKSSISMVEATTEALGGEPDHPAVIAIREGVQALKTLVVANKEAALKTVRPQRQLPPGQPGQPQQPQQRRPPSAQDLRPDEIQLINQRRMAQAKAAQQSAAAAKTTPDKQPRGPQVVSVPTPPSAEQPAPTQPAPPAAEPVAITPPAEVVQFQPPAQPGLTADGFPEAAPGLGLSHFAVLAEGVRAMRPVEEVAKYFVDLVAKKEPSLEAELAKVGHSPFELLSKTVGGDFITANFEYFKALGTEIDEKGAEAGVWGDDAEEEGGEEEQPAEGEDSEAPAPVDDAEPPAES